MSDIEIQYQQTEENSEDLRIFSEETDRGFTSDFIVHQEQLEKISKVHLGLQKSKIFHMPSPLTGVINRALRRKNEIVYCISTKEMSIDIKNVTGQVYLPLITKQEINLKLQKLPADVRSKMSMVHLGAVKILLKAQFRDGINSPLKMALIDNRINSRNDCILGAAKGNLAYGKFMFTVYPKFGLSLQSQNLDQVLSFVHEFERSNLMNPGDKIFSLTYLVGYALTNSHHSIDYKAKAHIELDDVFQDIGQVEENQFTDLTSEDNSWAINIAKEKTYLGIKPRLSITRNRLSVGESSNPPIRNAELSAVSRRIDNLQGMLTDLVG